jgi:hypothetical protein
MEVSLSSHAKYIYDTYNPTLILSNRLRWSCLGLLAVWKYVLITTQIIPTGVYAPRHHPSAAAYRTHGSSLFKWILVLLALAVHQMACFVLSTQRTSRTHFFGTLTTMLATAELPLPPTCGIIAGFDVFSRNVSSKLWRLLFLLPSWLLTPHSEV